MFGNSRQASKRSGCAFGSRPSFRSRIAFGLFPWVLAFLLAAIVGRSEAQEPPVVPGPAWNIPMDTLDAPLHLRLSWNISNPNAWSNYHISVYDSSGTFLFMAKSGYKASTLVIGELHWFMSGLAPNTQYRFTVQAVKEYFDDKLIIVMEEKSSPSEFLSLRTASVEAPVLIAPEDGAVGTSREQDGGFVKSRAADSYSVQMDTVPDFLKPIHDISVTNYFDDAAPGAVKTGTIFFPGLRPNTTYYLRMKGLFPGGETEWTPVREFTTGSLPFVSPTGLVKPLSPPNGAVGLSQPLALSWAPYEGKEAFSHYRVRVFSIPEIRDDFSSGRLFLDTTLTGLSLSLTGLDPDTTYRWSVAACDSTAMGAEGRSNFRVNKYTAMDETHRSADIFHPFIKGTKWEYVLNHNQSGSLHVQNDIWDISMETLDARKDGDSVFFDIEEIHKKRVSGAEAIKRNISYLLVKGSRLFQLDTLNQYWISAQFPVWGSPPDPNLLLQPLDTTGGIRKWIKYDGKILEHIEYSKTTADFASSEWSRTILREYGLIDWSEEGFTGGRLGANYHYRYQLVGFNGAPFDPTRMTLAEPPIAILESGVPADQGRMHPALDGILNKVPGWTTASLFDIMGKKVAVFRRKDPPGNGPLPEGMLFLKVESPASKRFFRLVR